MALKSVKIAHRHPQQPALIDGPSLQKGSALKCGIFPQDWDVQKKDLILSFILNAICVLTQIWQPSLNE